MVASQTPDSGHLYEIASAQQGLFTTQQAAEAGYSKPLLTHHVKGGRFVRVRRGIYRLVQFPPGEYEDLVAVWLWSERQGVFSHQTALALHDLSDVLPARVHMTLPNTWRKRRLRVPEGVVLHFAEIPDAERAWVEVVPVTKPARTLRDCAANHFSADLLEQAIAQARERGLIADDAGVE